MESKSSKQSLPETHLDDDEPLMEESEGLAPWIITFADMVTLLMVFFILLYAMGTIEEEKFKQIRESLRTALGSEQVPESGTREGLDAIQNLIDAQVDNKTIHAVDEVGAMVSKEIKEITSEVEEFVYKNKLSGQVQVSQGERGAIITISDVVLFPPGKARMTFKGRETLKDVFDLLNQFNYDVKIEGHTDDTPIHTDRFPSNWELSSARAAEVARMLIAEGFPPQKLSVEGFAEYRPKVPNTNAKNRAVNRRIEIVYQRGSIRKRMVNLLNR
ncbi:OmpA/MotB family protein [Nitrospina watsonii]|uniref:Flagellar motor rotation protein MotB n=1 Tax=Nitrospina watsonii TaxID=1323948 RepID=A0ABM9HCR4_9BACT|nr:flagellar motor protein MotB [Nitrospina watsonii]CAI2718000.1 Flagellar motor rotation protein MotB [Nitrospina watsonii]